MQDIDRLFEEISIYRQQDGDIVKEEFSDPYNENWNFSVLVHIIPPYGPGTHNGDNLNKKSVHIIRKRLKRVLPMMTCFERVSSVISFDEIAQSEKMNLILTTLVRRDAFKHLLPSYHTYMFSFNEKFNTVGNQLEFVNLIMIATYGAMMYLDLVFNKGSIDLVHQCVNTFNKGIAGYTSINTLLSGSNPKIGILNFIKNVRLYGTHKI